MTTKRLLIILMFVLLKVFKIRSKEIICSINGRKSLNIVDKRFISFSIDPLIFFSGFNASSTSMKLAQHLSPAFLRISEPSTNNLQFSDSKFMFDHTTDNFVVTPLMWKSLNDWITTANLTPVYSIDKQKLLNDNFENFLAEIRHYESNDTYWELNHDFKKDQSLFMYTKDLSMLKKVLNDNLPSGKMVANLKHEYSEVPRKLMYELEDLVNAVNWEPQHSSSVYPIKERSKSFIPMWLTVPESEKPEQFSSALLWAKQMGESARLGYEAIFKQPGLRELSADTPVYWVSLIYKMLMGQNVLEVKSIHSSASEFNTNVSIYAHCTKKQDTFSKQGAMTVFVINNNPFEYTVSIRAANSYLKSMEVQSYILTSDSEDSTNVYLNDEKLTLDNSYDSNTSNNPFIPKYKRLRTARFIHLNLPKESIGFFVFPGARIPVCINREEKTRFIIEELQQDNNLQFSELDTLEDLLSPQVPDAYINFEDSQYLNADENMQIDNQENYFDLKPSHIKITRDFNKSPMKRNKSQRRKKIELELTNEEIKRILKERAKSKTPNASSEELESDELENANNLIKKVKPKQMGKKKEFALMNRLREKLKTNKNNRQKRDINMDLLMKKVQLQPSSNNKKKVQAMFERSDEEYEELTPKDMEKNYPTEIQAELATSVEAKSLEKLPGDGQCEHVKYVDERIQFLNGPSDSSGQIDDLTNYHNFHENLRFTKVLDTGDHTKTELFELENIKNDGLKSNELPKNKVGPSIPNQNPPGYFSVAEGTSFPMNGHMYGMRHKRESSNITRGDIKNYRKFMTERLRVIKKAKHNDNRIGLGEHKFQSKKVPSVNENGSIVKEPQVNQDRKKRKQINRLMGKRLQERIKSNERHKRANNDIYKYETITEKVWKPEDIFKIKRAPSISIEIINNLVPEEIPLSNKIKRNFVGEINSEENAIEDFPTTRVQKFSKLFDMAKWYTLGNKTNISNDLKIHPGIESITEIPVNETTQGFDTTTFKFVQFITGTLSDKQTVVTTSERSNIPYQSTKSVGTTTNGSIDKKTEGAGKELNSSDFIDMIVSVVNKTISNVVHLSEKLTQLYTF